MLPRLLRAMSPAALLASVFALVLAGAGIGYSASLIGTSDIKNNAVTSAKIKDGTIKKADLVKEAKYKVPTLGNGGQGDCVWTDLSSELPSLPKVSYRVDRFGTTHLLGIIQPNDVAANGDGECGNSTGDEAERFADLTAFRLPKSARPAVTVLQIVPGNSGDPIGLVIPGRHGLAVPGATPSDPPTILPWGAVIGTGSAGNAMFLNGVTFETAKVGVAGPVSSKSPKPRELRTLLGLSR